MESPIHLQQCFKQASSNRMKHFHLCQQFFSTTKKFAASINQFVAVAPRRCQRYVPLMSVPETFINSAMGGGIVTIPFQSAHRALIGRVCIPSATEPLHTVHEEEEASMHRKLAKVLALLALVGSAPLLSACYTTAG